MRKLITIVAVVTAFSLSSSAQIEQGRIMLGGSLGFSSSTSETDAGGTTADGPESSGFEIMPYGGYFITDNIAVGLGVGYSSSTTDDQTTETEMSAFNVEPFARYYMNMGDRFYMFAHLGIPFESGTSETTTGGVTADGPETTSFGVGITPGLSYFVSDNVVIEAAFGFLGYTSDVSELDAGGVTTETTSSSFGLDLDSSTLLFGFSWFIN